MDDRNSVTQATRRRMLLTGGSVVAVATPLGLLASRASAQTGAQTDWRYCGKCSAMFWDGTGDKGRCPASGGHAAQGFSFVIHYDAARGGADSSQYDWRFCSKCKAMYWDGSPNKGHCPAGGGHSANGFNFGLNFKNPGGSTQTDWRFCSKCEELFWSGAKGVCAAGGAHAAQGFNFSIPFVNGPADPAKVITEAVGRVLPDALTAAQPYIVQQLGAGDLLGKGYTLHDMNFHFGASKVTYNAGSFEISLTDNYLYTRVTQPSFLGAEADPAFEIHFDGVFRGTVLRLPSGKYQAQNVVAQITRIEVKPRNVTGGIVTTVVRFFQMTNEGGKRIQLGMDKLRLNLTDKINGYLQTFS